MRCLAVLFCITTTVAGAQQPTPPPADSARAESVPAPPPPPTLEQKRFVDGLRTATRGIAQLKDGLNRVARTQARSDSASQRRAGRFLRPRGGRGHAHQHGQAAHQCSSMPHVEARVIMSQ